MFTKLTITLWVCLWATVAIAQGPINPPIYGTGIINVQPGTTVNTTIANTRSPPANLNVLAQGTINTWNIALPNPAFDGQLIGIGCPGGSASTVNVTSPNSTVSPGGLTSCTTGVGVAVYYQYTQTYNTWYPIFNTTGSGGGSGGLTVGSTTVANGTTGNYLTDNGGVLGNISPSTASNAFWINPLGAPYYASGLITSGLGSMSSSSSPTHLTLSFIINGLQNGMGVQVVGAGAASATLNTTVVSGAGTLTLVLANSASTTVSGAVVNTIGTMGATSHTLTVASTTGWLLNEGIDVAGAGTAGADLITYVTAVGTTTLTLNSPSVGAVTNAVVNHDDTAAINTALATGLNIQLPLGGYNITSVISVATPQWLQCSGAVQTPGDYGTNAIAGGTVFWNRGKTNNLLSVTSQQPHVLDCGFIQANDITPSAGYCMQIGSGSATLLTGGWIQRNFCWNTYQLVDFNQGIIDWNITNNLFYGYVNTHSPMALYNNPSPAGDNKIIGNSFSYFGGVGAGLTNLSMTSGDTNTWTSNKFNGCGTCVSVAGANNQTFIGGSFEGTGSQSVPLFTMSSGSGLVVAGNEFGLDNGHGAMSFSGSSDFITVAGNAMNNDITGNPAIASSTSGSHLWFSGNTNPGGVQNFDLLNDQTFILPQGSDNSSYLGIGNAAVFGLGSGSDGIAVGGSSVGNGSVIGALDPSGNTQVVMGAGSLSASPPFVQGLGLYALGSVYWGASSTNLAGSNIVTQLSLLADGTLSLDDQTIGDSLGGLATGSMRLVATFNAGNPPPTCTTNLAGLHLTVTDATSPTYHGTYTNGGAVVSPIFCNGTAWITD